ncbi:spore germination protein [Peribacillus simplex]|uniref:Spore germination protein n=1 Tax=Peribacillus simplex TaxID=1478 RepID=A0A8B5XV68_9BACI|nr:spore germination protein [Peribacillus simplex]MEC1400247.1 spore germination protein [Peribacillus simplex]MED3912353.1 spore germination protein [Peribacillus simplex]TVX78537.1 spore germination protein [Peribacillus simplex]
MAIQRGLINENIEQFKVYLEKELGANSDLLIREFQLHNRVDLIIVYIDGICDKQVIETSIIKPILEVCNDSFYFNEPNRTTDLNKYLKDQVLSASEVEISSTWDTILSSLVSGNTVIFFNKSSEVLVIGTKSIDSRSISEPTTQVLVRGPKDSFTEKIRTNTSLVRSRIQHPSLRIEFSKLGERTQTDIAILYIEDVVDASILKKVKEKVKNIKIDGILESRYIESFLEDETYSPFPRTFNTERPDVMAGNLLEGRIGILVNGTPFGLICPTLLMDHFKTAEDYYEKSDISSFMRLLRIFSFIISLLTPGVYVALVTHHIGMIPTNLAVSIAAQREGVPFPTVVEIFLLEVTFEILREAGIRIPRASGQAASIVGALIIGQGVVEAGFVSSVSTIIVALTAISSFAVPQYSIGATGRILRFVFLFMGAFIGLYGIMLSLFFIGFHIAKLNSFGVPYLLPVTPFNPAAQQDNFIRMPWRQMKRKNNKIRDEK